MGLSLNLMIVLKATHFIVEEVKALYAKIHVG